MSTIDYQSASYDISVEIPKKINSGTHKMWLCYAPDLATAEDLVAKPPLSAELMAKLKRGTFITARYDSDDLRGQGDSAIARVAAFARIMAAQSGKSRPKIAVCTNDGIFINGEPVDDMNLGLCMVRRIFQKKKYLILRHLKGSKVMPSTAWSSSTGEFALGIATAALGDSDLQILLSASCEIAELVLTYLDGDKDAPRAAIDTSVAFTQGRATAEELDDSSAVFVKHWAKATLRSPTRSLYRTISLATASKRGLPLLTDAAKDQVRIATRSKGPCAMAEGK